MVHVCNQVDFEGSYFFDNKKVNTWQCMHYEMHATLALGVYLYFMHGSRPERPGSGPSPPPPHPPDLSEVLWRHSLTSSTFFSCQCTSISEDCNTYLDKNSRIRVCSSITGLLFRQCMIFKEKEVIFAILNHQY